MICYQRTFKACKRPQLAFVLCSSTQHLSVPKFLANQLCCRPLRMVSYALNTDAAPAEANTNISWRYSQPQSFAIVFAATCQQTVLQNPFQPVSCFIAYTGGTLCTLFIAELQPACSLYPTLRYRWNAHDQHMYTTLQQQDSHVYSDHLTRLDPECTLSAF